MGQTKIQKPEVVIFDISGTAARESLVEKILIPYFQKWHRNYLETKWDTPDCQKDAKAILASIDNSGVQKKGSKSGKVDAGDKKSQIDAICKYIADGKENKAVQLFRFHVWFDGYDNSRIATQVYSDVAVTIQKWQLDQKVKLYVLSNGWAEATKKFMSKTSHGDLAMLIEDYFDNSIGPLDSADTYKKIVETKIKEKPENCLFLTKSLEEARAAKKAGLQTILVLTHQKQIEAAIEKEKEIPVARSFTEIEFI